LLDHGGCLLEGYDRPWEILGELHCCNQHVQDHLCFAPVYDVMAGQGLVEVVADVSFKREPLGDHPHGLPLASEVLEEHHQLGLKNMPGSTEGFPTSA
jgi:hypothetical protein